jgi:hypothetical protein
MAIHRVTCKNEKTGEVIWRSDMTEEQYEQFLGKRDGRPFSGSLYGSKFEAPPPTAVYVENGREIQRWEIRDQNRNLICVVEKQRDNDYLRLTAEGHMAGWFETWRGAVGLVPCEY